MAHRFKTKRSNKDRNKPCPCGSGRKYKNCCWNKDIENIRAKKIKEYEDQIEENERKIKENERKIKENEKKIKEYEKKIRETEEKMKGNQAIIKECEEIERQQK